MIGGGEWVDVVVGEGEGGAVLVSVCGGGGLEVTGERWIGDGGGGAGSDLWTDPLS